MKLIHKIAISLLAFTSIAVSGYAQSSSFKDSSFFYHSFSVQFNPAYESIGEVLWHGDSQKTKVYALRYTYRINKNFSAGPELSGYNYRNFMSDTLLWANLNKYNAGGFVRYSIHKLKVIKPYAEISLYYNKTNKFIWLSGMEEGFVFNTFNRFGAYIAPGISLCFLKNRVNLDLMYKFSYLNFANNKYSVFSWRIGYNFNLKK